MFFFFKQKTAYEMRISDWSSDVCSSDLAQYMLTIAMEKAALIPSEGKEPIKGEALEELARQFVTVEAVVRRLSRMIDPDVLNAIVEGVELDQIGRASCRESVCQYV